MRAARKILGSRQFPKAVVVVAMLVASPCLFVGLQFDDYLQRTILLESNASIATAVDRLFVFMDGDVETAGSRVEVGAYPWFALPTAQVAFWRPLAAATHWLDYQLWPRLPSLMHAHSLVWFGLLAGVVSTCYRRLFADRESCSVWRSREVAGLATFLYVFDDARGFAAGWLANRNALLAAVLGFMTLVAHHHMRQKQWRLGRLLSPVLLVLALLAGESSVAIVAFLVAYECCLVDRSRSARFRALLPYGVVVVGWRLVYAARGFGSFGTSYVDPLDSPMVFLSSVGERLPILLLGQWAFPPSELFALLTPGVQVGMWLAGVVVGVAVAWMTWSTIRVDPLARFFALGMLLACIPACAALPANRLLFFVGFGAFGLLAVMTGRVGRLARHRICRSLVWLHLLQAPLLAVTAYSPALMGSIEGSLATVPADAQVVDQTAVFVNPPSHFHIGYLPDIRGVDGVPTPARIRYLASGLTAVEYHRIDPYTLVVRPRRGFVSGFETVFRDANHGLRVGDTISLSDLEVEILSLTSDQRPLSAAFRFRVPLEDPSLRWLRWTGDQYRPFSPPSVGETIELQPPRFQLW